MMGFTGRLRSSMLALGELHKPGVVCAPDPWEATSRFFGKRKITNSNIGTDL
jgi:hypothetical protein